MNYHFDFENISIDYEENFATINIGGSNKSHNTLDKKTLEELLKAIKNINDSENFKSLILTSSGKKSFLIGADINEMINFSVREALEFSELGHKVMSKIEKIPMITIAAVHGDALGGGFELVLACDLCIAAEDAEFGLPEIKLGITPGFGGTQRLPKKIGYNQAKEMILTGEKMKAKKAEQIGMINQVFPKNKVMEKAKEKARKIGNMSKIPVNLSKSLINVYEINQDKGLELEKKSWALLFDTDDQEEGMRAFLEGREAVFEDK